MAAARLIQDRDGGMRVGPAENEPEPRHGFWRKLVDKSPLLRTLVGWVCLVIGLLGIILPIIPGIPFLIAGLALLSTEHRWVRSLLVWTKRRLGRWWPQKIKIPPLRRKSSRPDDQAP